MDYKAKILVIDDEPGMRDMLTFELGHDEYTIFTAENGLEGIEKIRRENPDVVITDIKMPGMNGIEVLEQAKKLDPDIEVIIATGYGTEETAIAGLKKGAGSFIKKPADIEEIRTTIEKLLEKRRLKQELTQLNEKLEKANAGLQKARESLEKKVDERTEKLKDSEKRYRGIINNSFDPIISFDRAGKITSWSRGAEETLGYGEEEIIGKSVDLLMPGRKERDQYTQKMAELNRKGHIKGWITRRMKKSGEIIDVNMTVSLLDDGCCSVILRDITREKEIDRMKTEFVSNVSHELRTPLTSIKGAIDLILGGSEGDISPEQKKFLNIVQNNTLRLIRLINDLLDISKIESGKIEMDLKPAALLPLINEVVEFLSPLARKKNIKLHVFCPKDFPEVAVDDDRIKQVLINLMSNGIKFTPDGGEVSVQASEKQDEVRITVTDTGIGIAEESAGRIFGKFQQLDSSSTRKEGGTGLGLAITKSIVEAHGGSIWVQNRGQEGISFVFTLPKRKKEAILGSQAAAAAHEREAAYEYLGKDEFNRILVIEDDKDLSRVIKSHLENEGYEVEVANSGREGIKKAVSFKPNAITLDILMREIDGFTVAEILTRNPETKEIPIIMVSALNEKKKGYSLGVSDFITKPFNSRKLINSINKLKIHSRLYGEKLKILIADKDPDTVTVLTAAFSEKGFLTCQAYDGREAVLLAVRESPDVIILELMMPEMNGWEVVKFLKKDTRTKNIPIIALSEKTIAKKKIESLKLLGSGKYLNKPISIKELMTVINQAVKSDRTKKRS